MASRLEPDQGKRPEYAVNTNWDLFQHTPTNTLYLRNKDVWLKATDVKGPWTPAGKLPDSFKKLPDEENWKDVKANLPGKPLTAAATPKVFVTLQPGELILLTGEPSSLLVQGTRSCGSATPTVISSGWAKQAPSTTWSPAAGSRRRFHRPLDIRHAVAAGRIQEDSARTRAFASTRVRAGYNERPKRYGSRRFRRPPA